MGGLTLGEGGSAADFSATRTAFNRCRSQQKLRSLYMYEEPAIGTEHESHTQPLKMTPLPSRDELEEPLRPNDENRLRVKGAGRQEGGMARRRQNAAHIIAD